MILNKLDFKQMITFAKDGDIYRWYSGYGDKLLGKILFGSNGFSIQMYAKDKENEMASVLKSMGYLPVDIYGSDYFLKEYGD